MVDVDKFDSAVKKIPNFPKKGILFYDITSLFLSPTIFDEAINIMSYKLKDKSLSAIAALESRGFLFAAPLARQLGVPLILIRKKGKLPRETLSQSLELEYGQEVIEIHKDDIPKNKNVVIVDDLLATGGTVLAAKNLLEKQGAIIKDVMVFIDLPLLKGRFHLEKLGVNVQTLLSYQSY